MAGPAPDRRERSLRPGLRRGRPRRPRPRESRGCSPPGPSARSPARSPPTRKRRSTTDDLRAARRRADATIPRSRAPCSTGAPTLDCLPLYLAADPRERAKLIALALEASSAAGVRPGTGDALDTKPRRASKPPRLNRNARPSPCCSPTNLRATRSCARRIVEDEPATRWRSPSSRSACPGRRRAHPLIAFPGVALTPESFARAMALVQSVPRRVASRIVEAMPARSPRSRAFCARRAQAPRAAPAPPRRPAGAAPQSAVRPPNERRRLTPSSDHVERNRPARSSTSTIHRSGSNAFPSPARLDLRAVDPVVAMGAGKQPRDVFARLALRRGREKAAVPSSRSILTKIAPASGDPRRRRKTGTFSELHRRRKAATQISLRNAFAHHKGRRPARQHNPARRST